MPGEFKPSSLRDTTLWQRLANRFKTDHDNFLATSLAQSLPDICRLAIERMQGISRIHPEFTLHDETHLLRVTELMSLLIPSNVLFDVLNPPEIALLILSAFFHDVGMVPDDLSFLETKGYREFEENWVVEHLGFKEAQDALARGDLPVVDRDKWFSISSELRSACIASFLREHHAQYSSEYVLRILGNDPRLAVGTGHLSRALALLCSSHTLPSAELSERNGFHLDTAIGNFGVNLVYLATILRLADILDFDRERTPEELYRSVRFTSPISVAEWEKHRSVHGWEISSATVRFECDCTHPEYERTIRRFLDFIDHELSEAKERVSRFPAGFAKYKIELPIRTDRSRVRPSANSYIYAADLQVTVCREQIVRLLMGNALYGDPNLAIRELLQNSLDALRHRSAIVKRDDYIDWSNGKVSFEHGVNSEGREYLRCTDNGVGMDENILRNFLLCAGRSYYRSPEFERERLTFLRVNADFDPCARFGIGFMSVFMLGEQILIRTRRYGGSALGLGRPFELEINGISNLAVLRLGAPDLPAGTSIEIVHGRIHNDLFGWGSELRLLDTLFTYAIATEFEITGRCRIRGGEEAIQIPDTITDPPDFYCQAMPGSVVRFEQPLCKVDPRLRGKLVCDLPQDQNGALAVSNQYVGWRNGVLFPERFVCNSPGSSNISVTRIRGPNLRSSCYRRNSR